MDHIKEERKSPNIDDIDQSNPCDDVDISEEGMSQNIENTRDSFSCERNDIKEETHDYINDIKDELYVPTHG